MTLASEGCLAATRDGMLRADAPAVQVVDGCGAGASFAAGFMYGQLRKWTFEESVRFAVAAGSFKCTKVGLDTLPLAQIRRMQENVRVHAVVG